MDKGEVQTFSEEPGLGSKPKGNMSSWLWEMVRNLILNALVSTFELNY